MGSCCIDAISSVKKPKLVHFLLLTLHVRPFFLCKSINLFYLRDTVENEVIFEAFRLKRNYLRTKDGILVVVGDENEAYELHDIRCRRSRVCTYQ